MSTGATEPVIPQGQEGTGDNPAWQEFLEKMPEGFRNVAKPYLQEWDSNVQKRIQTLHDEYAPYKPLKEAGIDGDSSVQAVQLLRALEADPVATIKAIQEAYGLTPAEAQQVAAAVAPEVVTPPATPEGTPGEWVIPPEFKAQFDKLNETQAIMAKHLIQEQQAKIDAKNQQDLETYLAGIVKEYPTLPADKLARYVTTQLANGIDGNDAAKEFADMIGTSVAAAVAPGNSAPVVLGAGGSLPSNQTDPLEGVKTSEDRIALVTQMIEQSKAQG